MGKSCQCRTKMRAIERRTKRFLKFRSWFAQFDEASWDAQIERDAVAGKLDALATEALADYHNGKATEL